MESSIVIKVKYGETLRRFNARVVDGELDFGMDGLREKVLDLFNFASDAYLTLTYVDEDGDVVALVDEEDLRDVMRQSLSPLRITVSLNSESNGKSYSRSGGSSTPLRSPREPHACKNLNSNVSEILKSVPEPLREAISKLSVDLTAKATSSSPNLSEFVDCFSKVGLSLLNQFHDFQAGAESNSRNEGWGSTTGPAVAKDSMGLKVDGTKTEEFLSTKSEAPTSQRNKELHDTKSVVVQDPVVDTLTTPASGSVNTSGGDFSWQSAYKELVPGKLYGAIGQKKKADKSVECHSSGSFENPAAVVSKPSPDDSNEEMKKSSDCGPGQKLTATCPSASSLDYLKWVTPISGSSNLGSPRTSLENDSSLPPQYVQYAPGGGSFKRGFNESDGIGNIFHRGVRCDGCGVHPITGPRFKSEVKENYDLCGICFAEMGIENDYIRIDRPVSFQHRLSFKGLHNQMQHHRVRPPTLPQVLRGCGTKTARPKLDSRFIQDVNVMDGTIMAPLTPFTKIWRMRNNGTIVWPRGSQLMWIGGDRLSIELSFEAEIPVDGLPVGKVIDIAVDFVAPELPGQYTSYWRMASSSGQKFGQRVWVIIQVDSSLKGPTHESFHGLNLNLPPENSGISGPEIINVNIESMVEDVLPESGHSNKITELAEPKVEMHPNMEQEMKFPINDNLLVGGSASNPVTPVPTGPISYPRIDFSLPPVIPFSAPSPFTTAGASVQQSDGNNDVEQTLLKELEEMGFRQVDLNKEILRMNEYDLEQSVDYLCGVSEWDPMLEELQEMGFHDREMNKKLLKKNNGSIKRVVMDLIAEEKA